MPPLEHRGPLIGLILVPFVCKVLRLDHLVELLLLLVERAGHKLDVGTFLVVGRVFFTFLLGGHYEIVD